ncbi:DUF3857 domain-containing protein [Undibacterium sp. SXout11W]|uniref:DUF3857 domain-containing protein n=1 Tax=Undibacterium sp. SXout11W TaxID=3413050 RepID=UPI003BF01A13
MRLSIFALSVLITATSVLISPSASSKQTGKVAGVTNVVGAAASFTRGTALPKWTQPLADIPATQRLDPVVVRLSETQAWVNDMPSILYNRAIQVNDQSALGTIAQFGINYYPTYQKLSLHRVAIMRAGQTIDQTRTVNIRLLQRETNIESGMYGGATTAQLLLDDVRIGDTLLVTYTIEGDNPVFGHRWASEFGWDGGSPIELRRLTVLHSRQRPLYWRQLGDFRADEVKPQIDETGGMQRLRFEGRSIEAIENEPAMPSDYLAGRVLQFSEYKDWQSVASWADGLFPRVKASPALTTLAQQFGKEESSAARVTAALHWVQNEIRYFSVSIGENSHRPQAPETVLQRRYGDCKDKSYLLVSLLNQLGIEARPVLLAADAPKVPAKIMATRTWFDHVIVQVTLDGQQYYVDPTRTGQTESLEKLPALFPGGSGLVVDSSTQSLITFPESKETDPKYELAENILIAAFDGDATLETREIYRGSYADWARLHFPTLSANELKKEMLALYEKQYRGVTLIDAPSYQDFSADNRFEVRTRFTLPKPVVHKDGSYKMEYDSQIIKGTLGLPDKLVRNFPFAPIRGKYRGRYRLNITWPNSVRVDGSPAAKTLDNPFFNLHEEYIYRGNTVSYLMDYRIKQDKVSATDLPELQVQAKKLNEFGEAHFNVPESSVVAPEFVGLPFRDLDSVRTALHIDALVKKIEPRKTNEIRIYDVCDIGVESLEIADLAGNDRSQIAAQLERNLRHSIAETGASLCLARVLFAKGDFAESVKLYEAELPLKNDSPYTRDLAWARFYAGDSAGAVTDMERFRKARGDGNIDDANGFDVASEIALLQRAGKPLSDDLKSFAGKIPDGPWPRPLLAMQVGAISPEALITIAEAFPADARALALHDSWYYIGQHYLAAHDVAAAKSALRHLNSVGIRSSGLYLQAKAELQRLEPIDPIYEAGMRAFQNKDYATAFAKWQESGAAGFASAQYQLGLLYEFGIGVEQNYKEAVKWTLLAAEHGNADAQMKLGYVYDAGQGVAQDYAQSVKWNRLAAEQGNALAQFNLGRDYDNGLGVAQDYNEAAKWYRFAADQGYARAQYNLGGLHDGGYGVVQDHVEAVRWYRRAAKQGSSDAQYNLGVLYENGSGVAQSFKEAAKWYRLAAAQGDDDAQNKMGNIYKDGRDVEQNYTEAVAWYRKAADQGNAAAQFNLGVLYANGQGVSKDDTEAVAWYRRSAEQGNRDAQAHLGFMLQFGAGIVKNPVEAVKWYQKAADQGSAFAQNNLADMYEKGAGVPQDFAHAIALYRQAANSNFGMALYSLGLLYEDGKGVPRNLAMAYVYYRLVAKIDEKFVAEKCADVAKLLSPEEMKRADLVVGNWKEGMALPEVLSQ